MKKFLFFSFLCAMFTMFSNTVNAQDCNPEFDHNLKPGDGCCIWLEQEESQVLSLFADEDWALGGLKFNLNPIKASGEDKNTGVVEYYYFKFAPACLNVDAKTKLSIDWEVLLNGQPWDKPLNATPTQLANRMNVEIEWNFPLINNYGFQGSGPLLSGVGLDAATLFTTVDGVKRAVKTDFPGQIDGHMSNGNGALQGYFNPYGNQTSWYNYFYADFLQWACENGYLRLKITRYSTETVQILFKLMERKGGTDFQEYYIGENQHDYMGGHGATVGCELGYFWLEEPTYTESEDSEIVCSGETIEKMIAGELQQFNAPEPPIIPDPPYVMGPVGMPVYNEDYDCVDYIDNIVMLTFVWLPEPQKPIIEDSIALCGVREEVELLASDPYEDDYNFAFNWYDAIDAVTPIYTGNPYPADISDLEEDDMVVYYVASEVYFEDYDHSCEGERARVVVKINKQLHASLQNDITCPAEDAYNYCQTVEVTNQYEDGVSYEWGTGNYEEEGCIEVSGVCDAEFNLTVTVTDNYSGCTASAEAIITIQENTPELHIDPAYINTDGESCADFDRTPERTGYPDIIGGCSYDAEHITKTYEDSEIEYETEYCEGSFTRTWTVTTWCGKVNTIEQTITIHDNNKPLSHNESIDTYPVHVQTYWGTFEDEVCVPIYTEDTFNSLLGSLEIYDNCTPTNQIAVRVVKQDPETLEWDIEVPVGSKVNCGYFSVVEYAVEATDLCGNSNLFYIYFNCPTPLSVSIVADREEQCNTDENTFELEAIPANGTAVYEYVWTWVENCDACDYGMTTITGENPITANPTTEPEDRFVAQYPKYRVTVTDHNGCEASDNITLTLLPLPRAELLLEESTEDLYLCFSEETAINIDMYIYNEETETTYTYTYDFPEGIIQTGENEATIETAGHYLVTATATNDNTGCVSPEVSLMVYAVPTPVFDIELEDDKICENGGSTIAEVVLPEDELLENYVITYLWSTDSTANWTYIDTASREFSVIVTYTLNELSCFSSLDGSVEVIYGDAPTFDYEKTNATCFGETDGIIEITAVEGGTPPYEYTFNGGESWITNAIAINLEPGSYIVGVIDSNKCKPAFKQVTITEPNLLEIDEEYTTTTSPCFNDEDGTITIVANGGTEPYYYSIDGGDTWQEENIFTVEAGIYTIDITDANECEAEPVVVEVGARIAIDSIVTTPVICYDEPYGTITVYVSGGTPNYEYQYHLYDTDTEVLDWVMVQDWTSSNQLIGTEEFNVQAGTYKVKVKDANNCPAEDNEVYVDGPTAPLLAQENDRIPILCFGDSAIVNISATGGIAPYEGTGNIKFPYTGEAGVLHIVTDAKGCEYPMLIVIDEQPEELVIGDVVVNDQVCYGDEDGGSITIIATGGTPPLKYSLGGQWQTNNTFTQLEQGTYTVYVKDFNDCEKFEADIVVDGPENPLTAGYQITTPIACYGGDATVLVSANGGTPPYNEETVGNFEYSYGSHTHTVIDAHGCEYDLTIVIGEQPDTLVVSINIDTYISCTSETATVTAIPTGGTPFIGEEGEPFYLYLWSNEATTATVGNLTPGTYTVTITDANGCTDTDEVEIESYNELTVNINGNENICLGTTGEATAVVSGGNPWFDEEEAPYYLYSWSNGEETATIDNLEPGTYTVTVTDAVGCEKDAEIIISYWANIDSITISAVKECKNPDIHVEVKIYPPTYEGIITINGYSDDENGVPQLVLTFTNDENVSELEHDFQYSGSYSFLYFIAQLDLPDPDDCDYFSGSSELINNNDYPLFYVYENSEDTPDYDPNDSEMQANINTEFKHYFKVSDVCENDKAMHLSVDYKYYYQAPGSEDRELIGSMSQYLLNGVNGTIHYLTPMPECYVSREYQFAASEGHFPFEGEGVNTGWTHPNATQSYNFFTLGFFDERQITVTISGLTQPGTYTIDYELVTHIPDPPLFPYYGNIHNGTYCGPSIIGGWGFYDVSPYLTYENVVLGAKTMKIVVLENEEPGKDGSDNNDNDESNNIVDNNTASATIYPNPATDNINIKFENVEGAAQLRIVNVTGSLLMDKQINIAKEEVQINISDLKPGFYFVNIISKDVVITRKLIIDHK